LCTLFLTTIAVFNSCTFLWCVWRVIWYYVNQFGRFRTNAQKKNTLFLLININLLMTILLYASLKIFIHEQKIITIILDIKKRVNRKFHTLTSHIKIFIITQEEARITHSIFCLCMFVCILLWILIKFLLQNWSKITYIFWIYTPKT